MVSVFIITVFTFAVLLFTGIPALAIELSRSDAAPIARFELRFFGHTNDRSDMSARLNKLENLVFGCVSPTQTNRERIHKLNAAITSANAASPTVAASDERTSGRQDKNYSPSHALSPSIKKPPSNLSDSALAGATYPKISTVREPQCLLNQVNNLERQILGVSNPSESLAARLADLENKMFGSTDACKAMSMRVARLYSAVGDTANIDKSGSQSALSESSIAVTNSSPIVAANSNSRSRRARKSKHSFLTKLCNTAIAMGNFVSDAMLYEPNAAPSNDFSGYGFGGLEQTVNLASRAGSGSGAGLIFPKYYGDGLSFPAPVKR